MAANRQRTSSNAGEKALKALHVLRQSGVGTVQAARLDAVSKSLALSDPTDKSPDDVVGRLTLDAETARRLVDAIQTTPPPLSEAGFGPLRARNASKRACDAAYSLLEFARRGACDGASLLLEAGFVPAAVEAYHRAVSVALGGAADAPLTVEKIDAFMLAQSCADALEKVSYCTDPLFSGNPHALGTSRDAVCGEYASLGILSPISVVFAARGDSPQLASLREATFRLLRELFMGISDRSLVDASLVTALGACLGGGDEKAAASAVCALFSLVDLTGRASGQDLTDAALQAFCTPEMVGAIVDMLARGHAVACGHIIQLLVKSTPHARAFATRRVVGALLQVVSLDGAALAAYTEQLRGKEQFFRVAIHAGFPPAAGGPTWSANLGSPTDMEHRVSAAEQCVETLSAMLDAGLLSRALAADVIVPLVEKLRASCVNPTPGPNLYELRHVCLGVLEALAPRHANAIVAAGGVDVAVDLLKQLKLPGSTARPELTRAAARNVCAFLDPLIEAATPVDANRARLELKAFASRESPEFGTFCEYAGNSRGWFDRQLVAAPGGPPDWLQEALLQQQGN
ncbi:unnamed protein product [Pelagomonas calceolata]|uniref:Uncharacterized protein n=1 Tax=Pelagomonas calceolata TaxID=35677 RepID=A0A7S4E4M9_9STRA|nr:unnamed protein product [Pelagomonas calceolata]|mmetsp:Transcript_5720/g.16061  ORF Transcript_5720/g.16061 Transcript_5720/m.16061 type:complete len:574 (+) Transcript_5720:83-1804(+)